MRLLEKLTAALCASAAALACVGIGLGLVPGISVAARASAPPQHEAYQVVPMPPGFHVENTELEGAVFADAGGHTLYEWPFKQLRNGITGDQDGRSNCDSTPSTVEAGMMSPYPAGLILPDVETRVSCTQAWPPVLAADDAQPIGNWTIIARKDGRKQWAYGSHALYTSMMDSAPGDVMGASYRHPRGESGALRLPVGPPPDVPTEFKVISTVNGRMLVDNHNNSVYSFDKDSVTKSACDQRCVEIWKPVLAPEFARPKGEWTLLQRAAGVRQWVFRGKPVYTNITDDRGGTLEGSDTPGWHNVYTQLAPPAPSDLKVQWTPAGDVLADLHGRTVYVYNCADDAQDQLACDNPRMTQAYRLAVCGGGDAAQCLARFPPVLASKNAKSTSRAWSIIAINPKTGHLADPGEVDALRVWAYRARPVYTFAGDHAPGDFDADGLGEFRGARNGFNAFWVRDDFYGRQN